MRGFNLEKLSTGKSSKCLHLDLSHRTSFRQKRLHFEPNFIYLCITSFLLITNISSPLTKHQGNFTISQTFWAVVGSPQNLWFSEPHRTFYLVHYRTSRIVRIGWSSILEENFRGRPRAYHVVLNWILSFFYSTQNIVQELSAKLELYAHDTTFCCDTQIHKYPDFYYPNSTVSYSEPLVLNWWTKTEFRWDSVSEFSSVSSLFYPETIHVIFHHN